MYWLRDELYNTAVFASLGPSREGTLMLHRMTKFDFPPHFWKALMQSFSSIFNNGVKSGWFGRKTPFSPKENSVNFYLGGYESR